MSTDQPDVKVAIVGSGFSGLGLAVRLKQAGMHDFTILERAGDLGGTWRDNSYPGCRCDVPSHLYSFSFAPNPEWSETYSPQPEIWDYLRKVAAEHQLDRHIRYGHDVTGAHWDDEAQLWRLKTAADELSARVVVLGVGALADPKIPPIPGLEDFGGEVFHSAGWHHDYDLTGKRVAVVGTGASAIQFVPEIQPAVDKLVLFQRTAAWVLPHTNRGISAAERWVYRHVPVAQRLNRLGVYVSRELLVFGLAFWPNAMKLGERLARAHLARQVPDRALRRTLTPDFRLGCKRIMLSNGYYPALSKPNVEVVPSGITEVRGNTVVGADGSEHEVDAIIFGTGFHVTDPPYADTVYGRDGRSLAEVFDGSPRAYLGTTLPNFPNAFTLLGPNTGLGHTSVVFMIEGQIDYVMGSLRAMARRGWRSIEVRPSVERAYNAELQRKLPGTVWNSGGCASWYLDANGVNSTIWPRFTWQFRLRTRRFRPENYAVTPEPR
ncbi:MAG: flavin-containing monooxygenase [Micromonosporaceae bacterium]